MMSETNKWMPMNGRSCNFGIYREQVVGKKPSNKLLPVITCLTAGALIVCFTVLSISNEKGNTNQRRLETFLEKAETRVPEVQNFTENFQDLEDALPKPDTEENHSESYSSVKFSSRSGRLADWKHKKRPRFPPHTASGTLEGQNPTRIKDLEQAVNYAESQPYPPPSAGSRPYPPPSAGPKPYPPPSAGSKPYPPPSAGPKPYPPPSAESKPYPPPSAGSKPYLPPSAGSETYPPPSAESELYPPSSVGSQPYPPSSAGSPTVKFTGVYIKSPPEDFVPQDSYYNGHAYVSDPFKPYKPAHPSEINHLATSNNEFDTGPRFSNKKPMQTEISDSSSVTQAIFHPYENEPKKEKRKPLKIMLDIYPITPPEIRPGSHPGHSHELNGEPSRSTRGNRMIVHLNLYPKKMNKRKSLPQSTSLVPTGSFQERMFDNTDFDNENDTRIEIDNLNQTEFLSSSVTDYTTIGEGDEISPIGLNESLGSWTGEGSAEMLADEFKDESDLSMEPLKNNTKLL